MKTYGYDYAFALSIDTVNAIMAKNLAGVDMSITYQTVDAQTQTNVNLSAKLAPWQIVPGGQNSLLNINVPITQGTLTLTGGPVPGTYDLGGLVPEMQITLGWVGTGSQQDATGSGSATHLTFDPNDSTDKTNPGYVATLPFHDPQKKLGSVAEGILSDVMAGALYSNKDKIKYIFANVNPAPGTIASWLRPAKWQYFFADAGSNSALCFLCTLSAATPFPANPSFDSSALQAGANSAMLISQPQFFKNVVLPGVQSALGDHFTLTSNVEDACTISNTGGFDVGKVTANHFSLTQSSSGNGLAMSASGGGPLTFLFGLANLPDDSYSWSLSTVNPLHFDGHSITFQNDPHPVETQDHTIYWYDWVLLVAVGITSLPGLISAIYDGINQFNDQAELSGISSINQNAQASTGGTVANLAGLIDWSVDGEALTPSDAGLSGALYVHGTLA